MKSLRRYRQLIQSLAAQPLTPAVVKRLRADVGVEIASELLTVAALQSKASSKFGDGVWMATNRALQQSTDRHVAAYKASLFGDRSVVDGCGGIGGDAIALSRRGGVVTIDTDPQITQMAADNLQEASATRAIAICTDALRYISASRSNIEPFGFHIDPDRRPGELRTAAPDRYSPSLDAIAQVLVNSPATIIKLAPAADVEPAISARCNRQWISFGGSVREQSLIAGECLGAADLRVNGRSAVRVHRDGTVERFIADEVERELNSKVKVSDLQRYIIDFDPAVRAAGLSVAFSQVHQLVCLGEPSGFFASDTLPMDRSLMQCFECCWTGPADIRQIRQQVKQHRLVIRSVKVRGTNHEPAKLQQQLSKSQIVGDQDATLLVGRSSSTGVYAAIGTHCK